MISREGRSSRLKHELIRALLFIALSSALLLYPYWVYRRAELPIASSRWLALIRASVLLMLLAPLNQILLGYAVSVYLSFPMKPFDPERLDTFELSHL